MKIGDLKQHCGNCRLIEFCGDPFYYCLCMDERFKNVTDEKYNEIAEKISMEGFEPHPPCVNCINNCDDCDEQSEENDCRVRFIADKVAKLL